MNTLIKAPAIKVGDNVDTDLIIAARYLTTHDPAELAAHCLEDVLIDLPQRARNGAVLVAGRNFGSGSSREHAPIALKAAGVQAVIAESFARIFFRNAFNIGLPLLECQGAAAQIQDHAMLQIDLSSGAISVVDSELSLQAQPLPPFMRELLEADGLIGYVKTRLGKK
ncbi:MAG: 3-isopropylmalate dehydratase small subunit [Candidatus Alcyoniella australis]|nr:3-isopropylmalate dehydratase small subunit [Candidatus Alcyoniella australis]